jgi:hypothetical protein
MRLGLCAAAVATLIVGSFGRVAAAQEGQEGLKAKLDGKLAEEWVANGEWVTDYDLAKEKASKSGKPIVAYFTRSYAP